MMDALGSMLNVLRTKPTLQERAIILGISEAAPPIQIMWFKLHHCQMEPTDIDLVETKLEFLRGLDNVRGIRGALRMEFWDMGIMVVE